MTCGVAVGLTTWMGTVSAVGYSSVTECSLMMHDQSKGMVLGIGGRKLIVFGIVIFFFQAEDGIRDLTVTGVQTCALPISQRRLGSRGHLQGDTLHRFRHSLAAPAPKKQDAAGQVNLR